MRPSSRGHLSLHILLTAELAADASYASLAADALIVSALFTHVDQLRALIVRRALGGVAALADHRLVVGADIHHGATQGRRRRRCGVAQGGLLETGADERLGLVELDPDTPMLQAFRAIVDALLVAQASLGQPVFVHEDARVAALLLHHGSRS